MVTAGTPAPAAAPVQTERATEWLMLTSGTSGVPKIVGHTLEGLSGAIVAYFDTSRRPFDGSLQLSLSHSWNESMNRTENPAPMPLGCCQLVNTLNLRSGFTPRS